MYPGSVVRIAAILAVATATASAQVPPPTAFRVRPTELNFRAVAAGELPAALAIGIGSLNVPPTPVVVSVDSGPNDPAAPNWLRVRPSRSVTPTRIRAEITRTDLAPGEYRARITARLSFGNLTLTLPSIPVTLRVFREPPVLEVVPKAIRLIGKFGSGNPATEVVLARNGGSGGLPCGSVVVRESQPWLNARTEGNGCRIRIVASPAGLEPGPYAGTVTVETSIGKTDIPVSYQVYRPGPRMIVFPLGLQFEAREGNSSPQTRGLTIGNLGDDQMRYRVGVVDAAEARWLRLTNETGVSVRGEATVVTVGVNPTGLAPGTYQALLAIDGEGARNSPMFAAVSLNVAPRASQALASPSPSGLVFNLEVHSQVSAPQVVTVFTSSDTPVPFQASGQALNEDRNWLQVQPASGMTSNANPARIELRIDTGGLVEGTYEGQLNTMLQVDGELEIRTVNVTVIIRPQGVTVTASPPVASPANRRTVDCAPARLSLTHTGLVTNFLTRAGWPTPLNVRLLDDCGQAVTDGNVLISFNNGDSPLALTHLRAGNYSGTWTPRTASTDPVGVRTDAVANGLSATFDLVGNVAAQPSPVLSQNGVKSNFYPVDGGPLAPGMIAAIFGTGLAGGELILQPQNGRQPISANEVTVLIGGMQAPLYYLSPNQINAQIPFELAPGDEHLLLIRNGRTYSVPVPVALAARQPGLAELPDGTVLTQELPAYRLVTAADPATRGGYLVLYLVGLGATNPAVPSADLSPANPLAVLTVMPTVLVGGREVPVLFAGLTPGFVGLYQINIQLPADLAAGVHDLVVVQGGIESNHATLPVR